MVPDFAERPLALTDQMIRAGDAGVPQVFEARLQPGQKIRRGCLELGCSLLSRIQVRGVVAPRRWHWRIGARHLNPPKQRALPLYPGCRFKTNELSFSDRGARAALARRPK